jgi:BTB/POZ domain-containing protein KCTD9
MRHRVSSSTKKRFSSKQTWLQQIPTGIFITIFVLVLFALSIWLNQKELLCGSDYQQLKCANETVLRPQADLAKAVIKVLFDNAESIAIVSAIVLYFKERPDRKTQNHYEAWQVIDQATQTKTSYARLKALEDLNADGISLEKLALPGADLSRIKLRNANLASANLAGANLAGADLRGADMSGANLQGATLIGSDCSLANFSRTDLRNTYLCKAKFISADFSGASFNDAMLSGSDFSKSSFVLADLRGSRIGHIELSPDYLGPFAPNGNVKNLRAVNAANFSQADFSHARLQGLRLEEANFEGATMPEEKS